jgi:hypothetical protein
MSEKKKSGGNKAALGAAAIGSAALHFWSVPPSSSR